MTHDNNDNSFIADNSTPRQRTLRLTALGLCWNISRPISFPLGSWLFDSGGYVTVFSVSLLLFILASALGIWGVWGFREKMEKEAASFKGVNTVSWRHAMISCAAADLVSLKHVTNSLKMTFKKRENKKRFYLQAMMVTMLCHVMMGEAETQCQFMYTKRMFGWEVDDYSIYSMVAVSDMLY